MNVKYKNINFISFLFLLLSLVFCLWSFVPSAQACPFCKEAIARMGEIWTSVGFNLSIYMMISVPFLLVGSFVLVLYLNYRKQAEK